MKIILNKKIVQDFIKQKTGLDVENCEGNSIYTETIDGEEIETVGVFDNVCEEMGLIGDFKYIGGDYYFIPGKGALKRGANGAHNYNAYLGRIFIYKLPAEIIDNWKKYIIKKEPLPNGFIKYIFRLSDCVLIWEQPEATKKKVVGLECGPDQILPPAPEAPQNEPIQKEIENFEDKKLLPGDEIAWHKGSFRDQACILLKIPESSNEWLNQLISKCLIRNDKITRRT